MASLKPVVSLEDLNADERTRLTSLTMGRIKSGLLYFGLPFLLCSGAAIYINQKWLSWEIDNDDLRSTINVILVLGAMLPARLFVSRILQHSKAGKAWKKKVVRGKIHGMEGRTVFISTQKVVLPADIASQFKVDDEVEIGISTINDIVIYGIRK